MQMINFVSKEIKSGKLALFKILSSLNNDVGEVWDFVCLPNSYG